MPERLLLDVYAALVGLVTGSYLNVVIHRLPLGASTVLPRSRCPTCGAAIRPRDNLPVLSWLLLRGRCRACRAPISVRYPVVEATTAVLFVLCMECFGATPSAAVAALFCASMVALAGIDAEHLILPDRITLPGIAVGVGIQLLLPSGPSIPSAPWVGVVGALVGAAAGAGVLLLAYGLWWLVRREEGLGLGDVKMLAMVGAFLGWQGVAVTLFFGAATGALFGLTLIAVGRGGMRSKVPFGVFLAIGALVALFAGPALVRLYLDLALGVGPPVLSLPTP